MSLSKENVANGLVNFASHLYKVIACSRSSNNVFLSPFSIAEALAMTLAGANGNTELQMKQVLKMTDVDSSDIHSATKDIRNNMRCSTGMELSVANRIFVQEGFDVLAEFVCLLEKNYGSTCTSLDFKGNPGVSASTINHWVSETTRGKIKDIIEPSGLFLTVLIIANAIYFKSAWLNPFDNSETSLSSFNMSDSEVSNVNMMHRIGKFKFYSHKDLESDFLWLPYAGNELSMLVILPWRVDGLAAIGNAFGSELLETVTKGAKKRKVSLWLPKFTLEQTYDLEETLQSMGMTDIFDPGQANLSKLSGKQGLCVSKVVHKAYVEVGEEGTEAAAATTVQIVCMSMPFHEEPVEFKADHPFMFCIIHESQKVVLFIGALKKPAI